jgi:hypothetical protein
VLLDRPDGQDQRGRDGRVVHAQGHRRQDLALARRRPDQRRVPPPRPRRDQALDHLRVDDRPAPRDFAHRADELGRVRDPHPAPAETPRPTAGPAQPDERLFGSSLFLLALGVLIAALVEETPGVSPVLAVAMTSAVLAVVLALGTVLCAALAWWKGTRGIPGRVHYTLVALALVALAWEMDYWNILGFRV